MRPIMQSALPPGTPRWHPTCEEPLADAAIEVDVGDFRVWRGVRFAPEREAFVDEETGARVPVVMWRYVAPH
jgi:hypothetical protein